MQNVYPSSLPCRTSGMSEMDQNPPVPVLYPGLLFSTTTQEKATYYYAPCACSPLAKIQQVSQPYASGGSPSAWTVYTYDGLGRTIKTVQPDGASTTTYAYSGNRKPFICEKQPPKVGSAGNFRSNLFSLKPLLIP